MGTKKKIDIFDIMKYMDIESRKIIHIVSELQMTANERGKNQMPDLSRNNDQQKGHINEQK